jgi:hypothetical protein
MDCGQPGVAWLSTSRVKAIFNGLKGCVKLIGGQVAASASTPVAPACASAAGQSRQGQRSTRGRLQELAAIQDWRAR